MSSVIWYLYEFARKSWAENFAAAKSNSEIMDKPSRFRDYPIVHKEYCIACGACTAACPAPMAIKLVRDVDSAHEEGITYPVINNRGCIRCGFCAEVCPTDPKTLTCGENHLIREKFTILPVDKKYVIDDYLCIRCKKCMKTCQVGDAIVEENNKIVIDQKKCISCGDCLKTCPVKGAIKGIHIANIDEQKEIINLIVDTLESEIEAHENDVKQVGEGEVFKLDMDADDLIEKARAILPNEELIHDIIYNITDRLKLKVITWDKNKCVDCGLCVKECPSHAIKFTDTEGVVRDPDKCLKCSICYQTCPFGAIGYYIARFLFKPSEDGVNIIHITLKTSDLPVRS